MILDPFFNAAFHASPIGQYLLAQTEKLEILAVNDAFLQSVSRTREAVLGMPLFDVFGSDPDNPNDTGVRDLGFSIHTAIATGQSQTMPIQYYPIRMQLDGRSWFQDMYWSATNTPIRDAQGTLVCISHTTIDITAQVLAEQALRRSREEAMGLVRKAEKERAYLAGVLQAALVAMSGYGQDADRAAALAAGFERYFVKPVDTGELAAMLDDIGRRRGEGRAG
jgi:PAS domain-containing protein